jgi:hypothetical protein
MAKTHRHERVAHVAVRRGEGALIDIVPHQSVGANGRTVLNLAIDLSNAPVPDRRYVADVASVSYSNGALKLFLGQQKLPTGLRSLLVIHMTPLAAGQFISSLTRMKNPTIQEIAARSHVTSEPLTEITEEPEQTVAFASNIVAAAISNGEACVDFYQVSAFSLASAPVSKKIAIDPVVRLDLRLSLLLALLEELQKLEGSFPPAPEGEQEAV